MEPQPPPSRKRKRKDTQDIFEDKVANLSLDDFPTPPGVNSFGGVDGQKFGEPRDASSSSPFSEDQTAEKRAPANEEERNELYKLDLAYFKTLYNAKSYDEKDWHSHTYWCRRKFWEHYYRPDPTYKYPEPPESPENQLVSFREEYANNYPPWWFPNFPKIEKYRVRYPKAWKHYENDNLEPPFPVQRPNEAYYTRLQLDVWEMMTDEQLEEMILEIQGNNRTQRERVNATAEVIQEYSHAIQDLKRQCYRWQDTADYHDKRVLRVREFMKERREEELAGYEKEPERKKRRTK